MLIYDDFHDSIQNVKAKAIKEINNYSESLQILALDYFHSRQILVEDPPPTGIALYLPFWLGEKLGFDREKAEELSLANLYLTLYAESKDQVVDDRSSDLRLIFLSDRLFLSFLDQMRHFFVRDIFWSYCKDMLQETLIFNTSERQRTIIPKDLSTTNLVSFIRKNRLYECGSFLKPTAIAAALIGKQLDQIPSITHAIDLYQWGLKLMDDIMDWKEDLRQGSNTIFLNCAREWCRNQTIDTDDVCRFMIGSEIPIVMLNESIRSLQLSNGLLSNDYRYFKTFLEEEIQSYVRFRNELTDNTMTGITKAVENLQHILMSQRTRNIEV